MTTGVRRLLISSVVLGTTLASAPTDAQVAVTSTSVTSVSVGAKLGDFHVAMSTYFRVPERDVVVIRDRQVRDDEIPVVLFIAQHASLSPSTVVDLRRRGYSWWDISVRYRLGPELYYVPVSGTVGPPYGHAYGYFKKPRNQWNTIVFTDADIVNLVQLRFLSEHYRVPPQRVMELRGRTADFVAVQREVSGKGPSQSSNSQSSSKGNGRGRGGR